MARMSKKTVAAGRVKVASRSAANTRLDVPAVEPRPGDQQLGEFAYTPFRNDIRGGTCFLAAACVRRSLPIGCR